MLGTRTKKVFAYGKRGNRIVNVSDGHENSTTVEACNVGRADKVLTPVAVKTQMRQCFPSESPSPQLVRQLNRTAKKKKRISMSHSPISLTKKYIHAPFKSKAVVPLSRQPLFAYHPNVPASPVIIPSQRKAAKVVGSKSTPLRSKITKPFSPFVDLDIIVDDDDGRRVSQERRVSRTDVVMNPPVRTKEGKRFNVGKKKISEPEVIVVTDSDSDSEPAPRLTKRNPTKKKVIIISSDESEFEPEPSVSDMAKAKAPPKRPQVIVEVLVSPLKPRSKPKPASTRMATPKKASLRPPTPKYVPLPATQPSRARQLTPIRRGSKSLFRAPSPPSPSTTTDFDLSLEFEFSDLEITPTHAKLALPIIPVYLAPLLEECVQSTAHEFSAFIETFPFDPIVRPIDDDVMSPIDVQFRKIGEASYSEVFGIGNVVLKVIPLRDDTSASAPLPLHEIQTPFPSEAKDVLKEIIVTRAIGQVCDGFVNLLRTYIVRGRYPELLLSLWDDYDKRKGSEGVRPDGFSVSQMYAIIVLPNGGPDLEAFTFANPIKNGWRQACSLFWQVARTLAQAEELVKFEHRDLHWGQILVKTTTTSADALPARKTKAKLHMDDPSHGVEATIIDLGLARMDGGDGVHWTPFDDEIFEGEGDQQFDVYRMMKDGLGEDYRPITNVMWLHYLATKLLTAKRLKTLGASRNIAAQSGKQLAGFTERDCHESLVQMEALLLHSIKDVKKRKSKKKADNKPTLKSADEVVVFGADQGWIGR